MRDKQIIPESIDYNITITVSTPTCYKFTYFLVRFNESEEVEFQNEYSIKYHHFLKNMYDFC